MSKPTDCTLRGSPVLVTWNGDLIIIGLDWKGEASQEWGGGERTSLPTVFTLCMYVSDNELCSWKHLPHL